MQEQQARERERRLRETQAIFILAGLLGLALLTVGLAVVNWPVACIVDGVLLLVFGVSGLVRVVLTR